MSKRAGCLLKLDLHVHTVFSGDAIITPREALAWARKAGLHGLAITDHDTLAGGLRAARLAERYGLLVLPGMELETRGGHVLALCPSEPVRASESLAEVVEAVKEAGGLAVLAHPYDLTAPKRWDARSLARLDAIEVVNAHNLPFRLSCWLAEKMARALGKPMTGGSDAHVPEAIGAACTLVDADADVDDVLEAIRRGRTKPYGRSSGLRCLLKKWAYAGFSR